MAKSITSLFICLLFLSCAHPENGFEESIDVLMEFPVEEISPAREDSGSQALSSGSSMKRRVQETEYSLLKEILYDLQLAEIYIAACPVPRGVPNIEDAPYMLTGDFNADEFTDTAFFINKLENKKYGLLIKHGNSIADPYRIFGCGKEVLNRQFDDMDWVGVFELVRKGTKAASNVDEWGDFLLEEVPEEEMTELPSDGIYIHAFESCGGGIIYWDKEKGDYDWIQQE